MNRKWMIAAAALAMLGMLWFAGCASDDDEPIPVYSVTVTAPSTGATWTVATTQAIAWNDENVDAFDISLSLNNGTTWTNVASNVIANSYTWNVPNSPSTTAKIRVQNHSDTTVFGVSGPFTIALPAIVDYWNATDATLQPLGVDSMTYAFNLDLTYHWLQWFNLLDTEIRESGTYAVDGDTLRFHATLRDGEVVNENYARWHQITESNSLLTLHVFNDVDTLFVPVQFTRVP
ncbi:GPI anchored serine-threonine rich family protein [bacterium]|nr:GPI anchored serine-threonine rich family protein [bacterium]MBU1985254.1 GPI anchored serine-threonine rich family protein [bacterium]